MSRSVKRSFTSRAAKKIEREQEQRAPRHQTWARRSPSRPVRVPRLRSTRKSSSRVITETCGHKLASPPPTRIFPDPARRREITPAAASAPRRARVGSGFRMEQGDRDIRAVSPRVDQVLQMIRGKRVDIATEILDFSPKHVAKVIGKVMKSAVANAVAMEGKINVEHMRVKEAVAQAGPTLKRFLPRAQGRATPILKRTSHILIIVEGDAVETPAPARRPRGGAPGSAGPKSRPWRLRARGRPRHAARERRPADRAAAGQKRRRSNS